MVHTYRREEFKSCAMCHSSSSSAANPPAGAEEPACRRREPTRYSLPFSEPEITSRGGSLECGGALRALHALNGPPEAYPHESNNNPTIAGSTRGRRKRPPTPPRHLPALKGEGSVVPLSRSGRERRGSVRLDGKAARLARLRADNRPSGGGFSCLRAGSAMRRNQRHCPPG